MDSIHKFLNIFIPIIISILVVLFLPVLILHRLSRFCIRTLYRENLAGKVVLITGASSGIGEHLAYEYAKHGANLALVARREELLTVVAKKAKELGSPDAIAIKADISKVEDCKRFVDKTIKHFGKLDCLINNAGIMTIKPFQDQGCITDYTSRMDVNFWGSVNATQSALPHLKKNKGRIVVIGSSAAWFNTPNLSIYNASKAAQQSFFETLQIELESEIKVTMVNLGMIDTPLANDDVLTKSKLDWVPLKSAEGCAKAIINSVRRGDEYLFEPKWMKTGFLTSMVIPEVPRTIRRMMMAVQKNN